MNMMELLIQWISSNFLTLFFDQLTIFIFLGLLIISIALVFYWTGHDLNLIIHAIVVVCFLYAGVLFVVYGGITITIPSANDTTNIFLNNSQYTNIEILSSSSSNNSNISQLMTYNITNYSEYATIIPSFGTKALSPVDEARKKLGGGMFSMGIGLVGLGIALISLGLYYKGNIDNIKNQEEIVAHLDGWMLTKYKSTPDYNQIYLIGLLWLVVGVIYAGLQVFLFNNIMLNLIFAGMIIMIYGYYQSKKQRFTPYENTFDEMFN